MRVAEVGEALVGSRARYDQQLPSSGNQSRNFWYVVAREMGAAWSDAQAVAFGIGGESLEVSSRAALRLFRMAVDEVRPLLNERQLGVVDQASQQAQA